MKDYVIKVNDNPAHRNALRSEAESDSRWCYINQDDEVKLNLPKTMVVYRGIQTAAICRLTEEQLTWYTSINQVSMVGQAKVQFIKSMDDIDWEPSGKSLYHQVHDQTPVDLGEDGTYTPTELHCVIF